MKTSKVLVLLMGLFAFRSHAGLFEDYAADFEKLDVPTEVLGRRWRCDFVFTPGGKNTGKAEVAELSFVRAGAGFDLDPANEKMGFHFSPSPKDRALIALARTHEDRAAFVAIRADTSSTRLLMEFSASPDEMLDTPQTPQQRADLESLMSKSKLSKRRLVYYMARCERVAKVPATMPADQ